ncbi:hypothetical protein BGW80DRAFT_1330262 [Lactifluus volemus]|nr:hypothetical protein BGW80DRAFT_1330262 [Lactifluus volemus]
MASEHLPRPSRPVHSIHTEVPLDQRSSHSALANAFGQSYLSDQQHSAPPSTQTITPSYPTDAASFGPPIPGPTLPVAVGGSVLSISSETSASSGQGTAVVAEGQDPKLFLCGEHRCQASFTKKKAYNRHFKDKHMPPGTCPECSFTWPLGRPDKLTAHKKEYHMPSPSHD